MITIEDGKRVHIDRKGETTTEGDPKVALRAFGDPTLSDAVAHIEGFTGDKVLMENLLTSLYFRGCKDGVQKVDATDPLEKVRVTCVCSYGKAVYGNEIEIPVFALAARMILRLPVGKDHYSFRVIDDGEWFHGTDNVKILVKVVEGLPDLAASGSGWIEVP